MKKQQVILISGALALFVLLYFFGNTIPPKTVAPLNAGMDSNKTIPIVTTSDLILKAKAGLSAGQSARIAMLENSVVRGDVKDQQINVYNQLSKFWGDTMRHTELGAYYAGEAAKLENSEKNLTFAAQFLLDSLMATNDAAMGNWLASQAKALFEKMLELNPANDSAKIGIGACYIFGGISDNPIQGIMAIKQVADKDSNNMYAQKVLGLGDIKSGQYDKAIEHFSAVIKKEPDNVEVAFYLAESFEAKGDKEDAVKWYRNAENLLSIPEAKKEIEDKIKTLQ